MSPLGIHCCHPGQQYVVWNWCSVPSALMLLVAVNAMAAGHVVQHKCDGLVGLSNYLEFPDGSASSASAKSTWRKRIRSA